MLPREVKAFYYLAARVPMAACGRFYRTFLAPREGLVRVQLGPGQKNHLKGWLNVDANIFTSRPEIWADFRNPLPFRDETVDVLYSHHMIEHLPDGFLSTHMRDMYRCLKPGGMIRIGGPNGDTAIQKLIEGDANWFGDYPDKRRSVGGRFANFIFCRNEHMTILTRSYLEELLVDAGFVGMKVCAAGSETTAPDLIDAQVLGIESEPDPKAPRTLIIEARRPV